MSKVKSAARAVAAVLASAELRPAEVRIARAVVVAVIGAISVKYGTQV